MDHKREWSSFDFLQCLETDVSMYILSFLNNPIDLVRASVVSRFWHEFVVSHGFAKELCLKSLPQLSDIGIVKVSSCVRNPDQVGTDAEEDWETLFWDHKVYAALHHTVMKSTIPSKDCVVTAVSASSTDKFPDESIANTLTSMDRYFDRASYWSSMGTTDPDAPETLIYKLRPGIWVISEFHVRPFEAFFQPGSPIYSAKSVRFRLGHLKPSKDTGSNLQRLPLHTPADDMFVWTYTSPEFPMMQENRLLPFKLPQPVISTGGFMLVELLGRAQRQEADELYYICICHVRAMGQALSPAFEMDIVEPNRKVIMKYHPEHLKSVLESPSGAANARTWNARQQRWWERMENVQNFLGGQEDVGRNLMEGRDVDIPLMDEHVIEIWARETVANALFVELDD